MVEPGDVGKDHHAEPDEILVEIGRQLLRLLGFIIWLPFSAFADYLVDVHGDAVVLASPSRFVAWF